MRIVVKVGTSTLAHPTGRLNIQRMEELCKVLSDLKNAGHEIILVSSGAIAMGFGKLNLRQRPKDTPTKQASAAVGQCELMYMYDKLFTEYSHTVAQLLITAPDIADGGNRKQNFHNTLERLLELGALPVINENDTISTEEFGIGDNDTLSAVVAATVHADLLVLLSDIDGLYDGDPHKNPDVQVNTYRMFVDASNIRELIRDYDFIIDGTDNFPAKFLINDACVLEKKPFSHAGIIRFKGQLMTYVPGEGPCYRCVFKNPPPKDAVPTCKQAGVIGAMGGVIGSLQAMEAIKYLIGVGELLTGYLLTYDALTMEFHKIKLPKDTHNCAVCGDHPTILEPIDYEQEVCEETAGRFDAPRTQE